MSERDSRPGLQSILTRQLLTIAAIVVVANILLVAFYDAADRPSLIIDVTRRELFRLETLFLEGGQQPGALSAMTGGIYTAHPEAYAFAVVGPDGRIIEGRNTALIPAEMLRPGVFATDWLAWLDGIEVIPAVAAHGITGSKDGLHLLFLIADDPANLIGIEILDEFRGHVWLPLLPIAIMLIAGTLLIIRRALRPVARAAEWARAIQPGKALRPLDQSDSPAEILDLTQAVRRSIERLDAELSAEQRRAAEAAHALRTPVAVLVARLDALPTGPEFDTLRADVLALSRMVTQFLSSSGADRLEIAIDQRAELNATSETVVAELVPIAEKMGSEIAFFPSDTPVHVHGSADAIGLALTNLVENAIVHSKGGRIEVSIGPGPEIHVRDNGPGLPDDPNLLFEPFRRGAGAVRGGAGLGLAIVARIQRAHGGTVLARTAPWGGAELRLIYRAAR